MNIVRKLVNASSDGSPNSSSGDSSLSLQHLRKLFSEFRHPSAAATVESQEKKFYNMLPLFCKVFNDTDNIKIIHQLFPEVAVFCSHASKLMVNEISRKARNQNTVSASVAIRGLLQPPGKTDISGNGTEAVSVHGWTLLQSLCLMVSAGPQLVDQMSASSLPSTLVKCVYLFYDLPENKTSETNTDLSSQQEFENAFSTLLTSALMASPSTAEELARKTDLMLLITAASSYCPKHNAHWHNTAMKAVAIIAKFGLKTSVVSFIHSKGAIGLWIENLRQIGPPPSSRAAQMHEYVDMVLALVGFIQETTSVTTTFLEDFRQNDGFDLIARLIFALETTYHESEESVQLIKNLLLAGSLQLATSGSTAEQLPAIPTPTSTVHVIPGFAPPSHREGAAANCLSIRFVSPLSLLSKVFNEARTDSLCSMTLEIINNLIQQDANNYFWLEQESLLSDLLLKIPSRGNSVQTYFFQIIEEIVTLLSYVPVKELNSITMIFKEPDLSIDCRMEVVNCLLRLVSYSSAFADAYRDMGIIELAVSEMASLASNIEQSSNEDGINNLLPKVIDLLTLSVATSSNNSAVIRECEGSKVLLKLVSDEPTFRIKALLLLQSLILAAGGEEELTQLMMLAQTCPPTDLELKSHIFKVVVSILRQNHRCRSMFRRIAGFVYTVSILIQLEGSLANEPREPWKTVKRTDILVLIRLLFSTLTIVMRYEPANARHFAIEVKYANLAKAIQQLGCFANPEETSSSCNQIITHIANSSNVHIFSALFHSLPELPQSDNQEIPKQLYSACLLFRFLLDMACDLLDRFNLTRSVGSTASTQPTSSPSPLSIDIVEIDLQLYGSLSIVHPGAISSMIHLIPAVEAPSYTEAAYDLQWFIVSRLSDLLVGMRNQQVMAEAGLASELMSACSLPLSEEKHFLHRPLVTVFERTAAHWLSSNDLRQYLRLGSPLNCLSPGERSSTRGSAVVPLERVKSLVSINTHKPTPPAVELDMRYEGFGCLFLPSICPMMSTFKVGDTTPNSPSPNSAMASPATVRQPPRPTAALQSSLETRLLGGVGTGERVYPPANALSYSCWFCIDQFSNTSSPDRSSMSSFGSMLPGANADSSHPMFLLLITKQDGAKEDSSDVIVSFAIFLTTSGSDRSLIVMTQEQSLTSLVECFESNPDLSAMGTSVSRFPLPTLAANSPDALGKWHNLVVTLGRPSTVLRYNTNLTVYLDGRQIGALKTSFVPSTPTFSAVPINTICGFIGTPPLLRRRSSLRWRLGPVLLAEDLLNANAVSAIYNLGSSYSGSYQSVKVEVKSGSTGGMTSVNQSVVNEDRIVFALHPLLMSSMTVAKVRKVFSKEDGRLVARQLEPPTGTAINGFVDGSLFGMPPHENATPVRIIHNAAVHLGGPARSLGAVLVGYLGVRTFAPRPCSTVLESIGGARIVLGLVANADSETQLYAAMKALVTALRCNRRLGSHMRLLGGYQLLSLVLRRKQAFISGHILQLILSYTGVVQLGSNPLPQVAFGGNGNGKDSVVLDSASGLNRPAFRHLVCDLRIWQSMPCDIQQLLYEQLVELMSNSPFSNFDQQKSPLLKLMFEAELPARLFARLRDPTLSMTNASTVLSLLQYMFCDSAVLLHFGQFLTWLLPPATVVDETLVNLENTSPSPSAWQPGQRPVMLGTTALEANVYVINLRNLCISSLQQLLFQQNVPNSPSANQTTSNTAPEQQSLNKTFIDSLFTTLGPDWLMLFLQPHLHSSTVLAVCNVIFTLLADASVVQRFREIPCSTGGGWLSQADVVIRARMGQLPGISVSSQTGVPASPIASASAANSNTNTGNNSDSACKEQLKTEICKQPGLAYLHWLLPDHANIPQVWFHLAGLFLGQPYRRPPSHSRFDTDSLLDWALGSRSHLTSQLKVDVCPEAGLILLSMARTVISSPENFVSPITEYPQNLIQFMRYLYNQQSFVPVITSQPFLAASIALLFPTSQMPRQFGATLAIKNVVFDLFKTIYMGSLTLSPFGSSGSSGDKPSLTHSVATRTTSILGGVAGTIGATVSGNTAISPSTPTSSKDSPTSAPLLDAFLNTCLPEFLAKTAVNSYRTELLTLFANSLISSDVLANDKAILSIMGNNYGNISANVFAFATRFADVLWSGSFIRSSHEIYEHLSALLLQARKKGGLPLDVLYRPLNRVLLYQLSRPLHTALALLNLIKALQTIHTHQTVIFGSENVDPEFIASLILCLLALTNKDFPKSVNELDLEAAINEQNETVLSAQELENSKIAVSSAARRVWEHVYLLRKNELEEATRTALSTGGSFGLGHDIDTFRSVVTEPASRVWSGYIEEEKRRVALLLGYNSSSTLNTASTASAFGLSVAQTISGTGTAAGAVIHRGLTRMSSKVAGFTTGLLSRSRGSDAIGSSAAMLGSVTCPAITSVFSNKADVSAWTQYHVSIVSELVNWRWQSNIEDCRIEDKRLMENWSDIEKSLLAFPGLWGPNTENPLKKTQLSMAEGAMRMRKLMLENPRFYEDYPLKNKPQVNEDNPIPRRGGKLRLPHSLDSQAWEDESVHRLVTLFPKSELQTGASSQNKPGVRSDAALLAPEGGESEELGSSSDQQSSLNSPDSQTPGNVEDRSANIASSKLLRGFLEDGDQVQHIYRCARVQGLDSIEGLLLFGSEHLYILDGFTLLKSKEIVEISRLPVELHRPIVPTTCYTSGTTASTTAGTSTSAAILSNSLRQQHEKLRYSTIREVLKRRYLLQPIAIEVFSSDGRTVLLAFPHTHTRRAVYSRLLSVAQALLDSAEQSVAGQRAGAHVEGSSNPLSALIGDRSVTDRWVRNEISNFQYLMHLNTLAQRSYQDLMQYPVFPWILADYDSETLDLSSTETFRDLSKPMGAQTPERVKQFEKRYREWEDSTGEAGPYHYGTHYSSAMIVASYLVRMEPFTQIFLRLQGGCFDLPDRMFHSVAEQWNSASRNNMTDVKELIPEFFYLPELLLNVNRFEFGAKQNGTFLDDAVLPPWAHGSPREFVRIHRSALESDFVSAHLNEWIDLIFGCKQSGPEAVEAVNVFHPFFYKGAVDIDSITDPVKRNATIGFINNFGQMPKQLFKKPHPTKKLSSDSLLANSRLVFHHVSDLQPSKNSIRELKLAVGQLVVNDRGTILAVEQNKSLIPPNYSHYVAWGFADMSIRLGAYESDKTIAIFEGLDSQMVLCSLCPSPGLLLTAGKSSMISAWKLDPSRPNIPVRLQGQLVGHTEAITCLIASPAFRILLSGSRNGVAMQWDLNDLCFIRELCRLSAPISAIATNELTGDIAVCATTELNLYSINGDHLCSVNACPQENQQVLCVAFSQMNEWDDSNIILTGGSDGVVRIWSLHYMQVPAENSYSSGAKPKEITEKHAADDTQYIAGDVIEDDEVDLEIAEVITEEEQSNIKTVATVSRSSTPSSNSIGSISSTPLITRSLPASTANMVWRYQIVFRGKLTSHTAFVRNDNRAPAAVTAVACSRDHRTIYVGDARGRLLSWSVPEKLGTTADHWIRDSSENRCQRCKTRFGVVERKHHCRDCGRVVCSSCSPHATDVVRIKAPRPVRVCTDCFEKLSLASSNTSSSNVPPGSPVPSTPVSSQNTTLS